MSGSAAAVEFRVQVSVEPVPVPVPEAAGDQPAVSATPADSNMSGTGTGTGTGNKRALEQAHETGEAGNKKQKTDTDVIVLEKGRIHLFYRPKVHPVDAPSVVHTLNDIQKTEIILSPLESKDLEQRKKEDDIGGPGARARQHQQKQEHGNANGDIKEKEQEAANGTGTTAHSVHSPHRMIRIPKKVLPQAVGDFARPNFAYVEMVSDSLHELDVDLSTKTYDTATRGVREQPAARLVASGLYEILKHHQPYNVETPTVLAYVIEFPDELGQAQQLLNIKKKGQFMIQIRNPNVGPTTQGGFAGLPAEQKPQYPKELMELFAGARVAERRFIPLDPVDFLNHRFCEFLVMPVKNESEIVKEWGTIGEELIKEAENEKESIRSSSVVEKIASELELGKSGEKTDIDTAPIVTGNLE